MGEDKAQDDIEQPFQPFHCDSCGFNVTDTVRIRCAECQDFDLCVTCFSKGKEVGQHKNWHDYRVVSKPAFPIFDADWGADEELLLLQGLEKFGMGNWKAVAKHVKTRTKEECEKHYLEIYVNSDKWPLPRTISSLDGIDLEEFHARKRQRLESFAKQPPDLNRSKPLSSQPTNHEIGGYMPGRKEFETEHENDAEQCVKDIVFTEEDTPEETELKVAVLEIFNHKIDKRLERKRFIFDRGLLNYKKNVAEEKKRTKEERDLFNRLRPYSRVQTAGDFQKFVDGLLNEMKLREQITKLQEYRQNGITTLSAGTQYERDKAQRQSNLKSLLASQNSFSERQQSRKAAYQPPPPPRAIEESNHARSTTPKPLGRKPANPLNIWEADGVHLLTQDEQNLCSTLRIMPKPYLVIKETILKEYARLGALRRRQARELIKIDVNKTSRIYDFFVEMGWVRPPGHTTPASSLKKEVSA
ncbi:uncharacterized protein VTP21DRAFT_7647 [Calcarisporiella thermophila]|uniref:uncharacterized protein n=1 Tax=Calcarisporiella thermophila TaxID=911321 RepID=UPI0037430E22